MEYAEMLEEIAALLFVNRGNDILFFNRPVKIEYPIASITGLTLIPEYKIWCVLVDPYSVVWVSNDNIDYYPVSLKDEMVIEPLYLAVKNAVSIS